MDDLPVSSGGVPLYLEQCVFYRQEEPKTDDASLLRCRVLSMESPSKVLLECLDSGKRFWTYTDFIFEIPEIFLWERFPATAIFGTLSNFEELKNKEVFFKSYNNNKESFKTTFSKEFLKLFFLCFKLKRRSCISPYFFSIVDFKIFHVYYFDYHYLLQNNFVDLRIAKKI